MHFSLHYHHVLKDK